VFYRSLALWPLGSPVAALRDADEAVKEAREIGQAPTLLAALALTSLTHLHCGNFAIANAQLDELVALADERGTFFWKIGGTVIKGCLLATIGQASESVRMIKSALSEWHPTGTTVRLPMYLSYLGKALAEVGLFDEARRSIDNAVAATKTSKESWYEAEMHRVAGEIAMRAPDARNRRTSTIRL
jgi:predicted ATPase